jgi:hypothetical protein
MTPQIITIMWTIRTVDKAAPKPARVFDQGVRERVMLLPILSTYLDYPKRN